MPRVDTVPVLSGRHGTSKSNKHRELLNAMTGAGPVFVREAARRQGRAGDCDPLLNAGLLSKTDDGSIVFTYNAIHVDFLLRRRDCNVIRFEKS
ncbi:MAG TPA: hypothetical protein VFK88_01670 [Gallionella sp.]|nr:hypothetical protein [Gallionella sp.]